MKIVHLCSMDFGGAGKAAYRLHKGLQEIGVDSSMIVMCKKTSDDTVHVLPSEVSGSPEKWWGLLSGIWNASLANYPFRSPDNELFSEFCAIASLEPLRDKIRSADIINLHWVAGLFDSTIMPQFLRGKKVVWTLHDMNPFTGGCHYAGNCTRFCDRCGECPQLASGESNDLSLIGWSQKQQAYQDMNITVVAPSKWLGACSGKSSLLGRFSHKIIPYGFPLETFKPLDRLNIRSALGINRDTRIVLFCADSTATKRKGFSYLLEALNVLSRSGRGKNLTLAIVGRHDNSGHQACGYPELIFGHVGSEEQMAVLYNAADVFVLPSLEDNLPNTVVESLACGTPVAAFNVGGVPDMVDHGITGYLAPAKDVASLADAIEWCVNSAPTSIRQSCRAKAESFFLLKTQAVNYMKLYDSISPSSNQSACELLTRSTPKISIVTPSFNQAKFLEACIDSILSQNYPNLEYIIMDGGSTDGSVEIIRKHERYLTYWQSQPDGGQYKAINEGFRKSTGEIMTWLNSDDMLNTGTLQTISAIFSDIPSVAWITGRPNGIAPDGSQAWMFEYLPLWSREKYLTKQFHSPYIQQEGTFWRRTLWEKAGGYIAGYLELAGDLELWSRFFRYAQLYSVDALLAGYRQHPEQKMAKLLEQYNLEAERVLDREIVRFHVSADQSLLPAPLPILIAEGGKPYV